MRTPSNQLLAVTRKGDRTGAPRTQVIEALKYVGAPQGDAEIEKES